MDLSRREAKSIAEIQRGKSLRAIATSSVPTVSDRQLKEETSLDEKGHKPGENDVLLGRGYGINSHIGKKMDVTKDFR